MKSPVIIKGNKMGIRLIIAPEAALDEIIYELSDKLQNTGHYYKNIRPISVTFDGKVLTEDEMESIRDTLRGLGLNIQRRKKEKKYKEEKKANLHSDTDGLFYIGNLKNGQSIEATESIVVVGNIEQGASVVSEGNVIIVGALDGYAEAGCKGRKNAFVYSLISGRNSK